MSTKPNLQEDFLGQLHRGRRPVAIYTTNGVMVKGRISYLSDIRESVLFSATMLMSHGIAV